MAEEIQSLLERIQKEGLQKTQQESEKLLSEARRKASKIIEDARSEAQDIVKKAKEEAELSSKRAEEAIRQAARDVIINLKNDLLKRLRDIVRHQASEVMTADFMKQIILDIAKGAKSTENIELILPKGRLGELEGRLKSSLAEDLRANPRIFADADMESGFKLGFEGEDVFCDFSDEALADMICSYVGPRIASVLKKDNDNHEAKASGA